jgi:hypothetical protein
VSDHFDGRVLPFFHPAGARPRDRADSLRWMIESRWRGTRAKWPAWRRRSGELQDAEASNSGLKRACNIRALIRTNTGPACAALR